MAFSLNLSVPCQNEFVKHLHAAIQSGNNEVYAADQSGVKTTGRNLDTKIKKLPALPEHLAEFVFSLDRKTAVP